MKHVTAEKPDYIFSADADALSKLREACAGRKVSFMLNQSLDVIYYDMSSLGIDGMFVNRVVSAAENVFHNTMAWLQAPKAFFSLGQTAVMPGESQTANGWHYEFHLLPHQPTQFKYVILSDTLTTQFASGDLPIETELAKRLSGETNTKHGALDGLVTDALDSGLLVASSAMPNVAAGFTDRTLHRSSANITNSTANRMAMTAVTF